MLSRESYARSRRALVRRRDRQRATVSHERWLVSYADFITLLFAFFTTLYAISTVDARKLTAVVDSVQSAFATAGPAARDARRGHTAGGVPARLELPVQPPGDTGRDAVELREVKAALDIRLEREIAAGDVQLEMDPRGLVISIREAGSFPTGSADLSAAAQVGLRQIAETLSEVGNAVRVEGHTDNVPIHTDRYRSNWELSTARATTVVAFFVNAGLPPTRFSAAGYGEFHPRVANDTPDLRALNRRVDVVVLNPVTTAREEPRPRVEATSSSADR